MAASRHCRARSSSPWPALLMQLLTVTSATVLVISVMSVVCFQLADADIAASASNSGIEMPAQSSNGRLLHSSAAPHAHQHSVLDSRISGFQEVLLSSNAADFALDSLTAEAIQGGPSRSLLKKKRKSDKEDEEDEDEEEEEEKEEEENGDDDEEEEDDDDDEEEDDDDDDDDNDDGKKTKRKNKKKSKLLLGVQLDMSVLDEHVVSDDDEEEGYDNGNTGKRKKRYADDDGDDDDRRRRHLLAAAATAKPAAAAASDPAPSRELGGYVFKTVSKFPERMIVFIGTLPREEAELACTQLATSGKPGFSIDLKKMKQKDGVDDGDDITVVTIEHHIMCLVPDKTGKMGANEKLKTVLFVLIVNCETRTIAVDCHAGATTCNVYATKSIIPEGATPATGPAAAKGTEPAAKPAAAVPAATKGAEPAAKPAAGAGSGPAATKTGPAAAGAGPKAVSPTGGRKLSAARKDIYKDKVLNTEPTKLEGGKDAKDARDTLDTARAIIANAENPEETKERGDRKGFTSVTREVPDGATGTGIYRVPGKGTVDMTVLRHPNGVSTVLFSVYICREDGSCEFRELTATYARDEEEEAAIDERNEAKRAERKETIRKHTRGQCFPAAAQVMLANGTQAPMDQVRHGDSVLTVLPSGNLGFSEVYLFGHKDPDAHAHFVALQTDRNSTLLATPDHYIHIIPRSKVAAGAQVSWRHVVHTPAGKVRPGDAMVHVSWEARCSSVSKDAATTGTSSKTSTGCGSMSYVTITSVKTQIAKGLYNPYTMVGNIVVDGYSASSHSGLDFLDPLTGTGPYVPYLHHAMLSPVRLIHRLYPSLMAYVDQQYSKDAWVYAGVVNVVRSIVQFHTKQT